MDSFALEVFAETNNDAYTGYENMNKKQRTDAADVTNPWLMGIFCSKDVCVGVVRVAYFLRTLEKLPVGWTVCNIQILRLFAGCS